MLAYYIALPFIYLISSLPYRLLYAFSDFLYFMIFHVFSYRRKVVEENLKKSFPEKTHEEIIQLSKKYYQYLCDLILETFKKLTISEKQSLERCKIINPELFHKLYAENKSIILLMGHYGNWEMAGSAFSLTCDHQLYVVYKTLSNKYFEDLMCKGRTKYGTKLIKMENTLRDIINTKKDLCAYAFIADQTPSNQNAYWTTFLNQDTAMFTGAEKVARKFNFPVVFVNIVRVKRGYYEIFIEMLCEDPKNSKENEIIENFARKLEKEIIRQPETWLWSHRRWKQRKPV